MIKHHLWLILRGFQSHKSSFLINIFGLVAGLSCVLLIYLWVVDELHMDQFHQNNMQLYQVMQNAKQTGTETSTNELTPGPLAEALAQEMPEVAYAVSTYMSHQRTGVISSGNRQARASEQFAGKDFFNVFSYTLIQGNQNRVLADKRSVLLSNELAQKLFSDTTELVGKTVQWTNGKYTGNYLISGIFKKPPHNSTAQFDMLFAFELYLEREHRTDDWQYNDPATYLVLKKGTDPNQFNKKISFFLQTKNHKDGQSLFIRPYADKYLYNTYTNGIQTGGRIEYVRLFSIVAVVILLIACVNFTNLSTAKAATRLKEIGIKKVMGANRPALIRQFLIESILLVLMALVLALLVAELLLPQFNQITGKELSMHYSWNFIMVLTALAICTGLISGGYPALYLSGLQPSAALKGRLPINASESWMRKGLVIFQFSISVILIITVLVINGQVNYIRSKNLGFDKDHVIIFKRDGRLEHNVLPFLSAVKNIPGVINATNFGRELTSNGTGTQGISWDGQHPEHKVTFKYLFVGNDFLETLGVQVKDGQPFKYTVNETSSQIIFNEAAIRAMGLANPVGKTVRQWGESKQITGVVKDFHFESLYETVKPCFFILSPKSEDANQVMVKLHGGKETEIISRIETFYKIHNPGFPFEFKFLDQDFQKQYFAEARVSTLSFYFALLAIGISCLGLFGLAAFITQRRFKEVGVRKVLGAGHFGLIFLLSRDFVKPVMLAILIGIPVGYVLTKNWLAAYAYRIDLELWYFMVAGLTALLISLTTVSLQTWKAASLNPADALRTD